MQAGRQPACQPGWQAGRQLALCWHGKRAGPERPPRGATPLLARWHQGTALWSWLVGRLGLVSLSCCTPSATAHLQGRRRQVLKNKQSLRCPPGQQPWVSLTLLLLSLSLSMCLPVCLPRDEMSSIVHRYGIRSRNKTAGQYTALILCAFGSASISKYLASHK